MKTFTKWMISLGHAILLLAFTIIWLNTNFAYGDERHLVQWSSVIKRVVLGIDEDPPKKDYLFINLAYDKALIPREDGLGNEVITDREKLTSFLQILKRHQQDVKFTMCDVLLKGRSDKDSLLQETVKGIDRIVFPTQLTDSGKTETLSIEVPAAIADYKMIIGGFLKFKLFQNNQVPTLPVYLYEKISKHKIDSKYGWYFDNNRLMMNSIIIDYQIRTHELIDEGEYPMISLSELLILPEEVIVNEFLKGRMILMGDFNLDIHETIFGETPGTLILLNVFLNLMDGNHIIHGWWIIFLLLSFTFFSRLMLFPEKKANGNKHINYIQPLIKSATFLALVSIISYLVFNQHIQVLVITVYINLLRFVIQFKKADWTMNKVKTWLIEIRNNYFKFN